MPLTNPIDRIKAAFRRLGNKPTKLDTVSQTVDFDVSPKDLTPAIGQMPEDEDCMDPKKLDVGRDSPQPTGSSFQGVTRFTPSEIEKNNARRLVLKTLGEVDPRHRPDAHLFVAQLALLEQNPSGVPANRSQTQITLLVADLMSRPVEEFYDTPISRFTDVFENYRTHIDDASEPEVILTVQLVSLFSARWLICGLEMASLSRVEKILKMMCSDVSDPRLIVEARSLALETQKLITSPLIDGIFSATRSKNFFAAVRKVRVPFSAPITTFADTTPRSSLETAKIQSGRRVVNTKVPMYRRTRDLAAAAAPRVVADHIR